MVRPLEILIRRKTKVGSDGKPIDSYEAVEVDSQMKLQEAKEIVKVADEIEVLKKQVVIMQNIFDKNRKMDKNKRYFYFSTQVGTERSTECLYLNPEDILVMMKEKVIALTAQLNTMLEERVEDSE